MKNIPVAIKILINILFLVIYSVLGIVVGDFLFGGLVFKLLSKPIPGANDPIHIKIAGIVLITILIITLLLRKYFYLSLSNKDEKKVIKKTKIVEKKETKIPEKNNKDKSNENSENMEIYIDKEIK